MPLRRCAILLGPHKAVSALRSAEPVLDGTVVRQIVLAFDRQGWSNGLARAMSFASLEFFIFLALVFQAYYLAPKKRWQNGLLVVSSYFFYGWWDHRFCFLMLASSLVDYFGGMGIAAARGPRVKYWILSGTLTVNLLLLGFFKYFNFFVDSLVVALVAVGIDWNTSTLSIILPVGISFYTFQTMSYTLDVYRGTAPVQRNLVDYLAFVSFFPQLVAGPIERASKLMPQFQQARTFSMRDAVEGCRLILWGLFKKAVLADNLAVLVNGPYAVPDQASAAALFLGTIGFAFQIYCDFSGYSDIAKGAGLLLGIRLSRNFEYPYFSRSIGEFWRRWHCSLSAWFRDYVYIPLGGSREGTGRTTRNLLVTFLLSGLWHGAAWKFVLWGGFHGACLCVSNRRHRLGWERPAGETGTRPEHGLSAWVSVFGTFGLVCVGWILFRADTVGDAMTILLRIPGGVVDLAFYHELARLIREHAVVLGALAGFVVLEWVERWNPMPLVRGSRAVRWTIYTLLVWSVILFGTGRTSDFIYFQF